MIINHLQSKKAPKAYGKFVENGQNPSILNVEWFYTLFTRYFNLDVLRIIWDLYLLKGDIILFRLVVYIFKYVNDDQENVFFGDLLSYIRKKGILMDSSIVSKLNKELLSKLEFVKLAELAKQNQQQDQQQNSQTSNSNINK